MLKSSRAFIHRNSWGVIWSHPNSWDSCLIRTHWLYIRDLCMRYLSDRRIDEKKKWGGTSSQHSRNVPWRPSLLLICLARTSVTRNCPVLPVPQTSDIQIKAHLLWSGCGLAHGISRPAFPVCFLSQGQESMAKWTQWGRDMVSLTTVLGSQLQAEPDPAHFGTSQRDSQAICSQCKNARVCKEPQVFILSTPRPATSCNRNGIISLKKSSNRYKLHIVLSQRVPVLLNVLGVFCNV